MRFNRSFFISDDIVRIWQANSPVRIHQEADNPLSPDYVCSLQRKNIYMIVKEVINNMLKHGNSTDVHVSIAFNG